MTSCPKNLPYKSPAYLDYIRSLPCVICGEPNTEAHHVKTRGSGGGDTYAVPLCARHHREIHSIGIDTFQAKHNINIWQELFLIAKAWIEKKAA